MEFFLMLSLIGLVVLFASLGRYLGTPMFLIFAAVFSVLAGVSMLGDGWTEPARVANFTVNNTFAWVNGTGHLYNSTTTNNYASPSTNNYMVQGVGLAFVLLGLGLGLTGAMEGQKAMRQN